MFSRARSQPAFIAGTVLSSLVAAQALAMAGTSPPTATSHPVDYCTDRDGDGRYDPNDCTQWHVEGIGEEALYDYPTNVVYRRRDLNLRDNCPQDTNGDQKDSDNDGIGDVCDYVDLGVGANHACARRNDSSVTCWGDNTLGQTNVPLFRFSDIAVGRNHACGLLTNLHVPALSGKVLCWGDNQYGQLNARNGQFVRIRADGDVTCAVDRDGAAKCWGACGSDESCTPDPSTVWHTVTPSFDVTPAESDTPQWGLCGLASGPTYAVSCFGGRPPAQGPEGRMSLVDGGEDYACAMPMGSGRVECFTRGEPDPSDPMLNEPSDVGIRNFSVGKDHACAITTDQQSIRCWGSDELGKSTPPSGISGPFANVGAGERHTCARKENGQIFCWGDSGVATGSHFAPDAHSKLLPVSGLYIEIGANEYVACGVNFNGEMRCSDLAHPGYKAPAGKFYDVWVGEGRACGHRRDGQTVCWDGVNPEPTTGFDTVDVLGNVSKTAVRRYYRNVNGQAQARSYTCGIFRNSRKIFCHDEGSPPPSENDFTFGPRFTDVGVMGERTVCGITEDKKFICQEYGSGVQIEVKPGTQFQSLSCNSGNDSVCCAHDNVDAYCINADGQQTRAETAKNRTMRVRVGAFTVTTGRDGCVNVPVLGDQRCFWPGDNPDPNKRMSQLEMGPTHGCTLYSATNKTHCWTDFGETSGAQTDAPLSGLEFSDLASGTQFSCGLTSWGAPACWGGVKPESVSFRDARGRLLNARPPLRDVIDAANVRSSVLAP
jgi:hypothetical protein